MSPVTSQRDRGSHRHPFRLDTRTLPRDGALSSTMIGLEEIRRCDEHPDVDFSDENEVKRFVRPGKWLSLDAGNIRLLRINVRPPAIVLASLRRATRPPVDPFRASPLAALDRARGDARVSIADGGGKIPGFPEPPHGLFPRRARTPGRDARARDAN